MAPIDLDRMKVRSARPTGRNRRPPRHAKGEGFLKGPIPLAWLEAAARFPGRACMSASHFGMPPASPVQRVSHSAICRAVASASTATPNTGHFDGLREQAVEVERQPGRSPTVTVLEIEKCDGTKG